MPDANPSQPLKVHMIGNAHIDPVWLWPMAEGRAEVLSTYRTAIMLLREFDGYVFTSGGAVTFQWVEEDDPQLFAQIQEAVAKGRWALVNGWWLQPVATSSGSQPDTPFMGATARVFGKRATVGYNTIRLAMPARCRSCSSWAGSNIIFSGPARMSDAARRPILVEAPAVTRVGVQASAALSKPETNMLLRVQEAARLLRKGTPPLCASMVLAPWWRETRRNVAQVIKSSN